MQPELIGRATETCPFTYVAEVVEMPHVQARAGRFAGVGRAPADAAHDAIARRIAPTTKSRVTRTRRGGTAEGSELSGCGATGLMVDTRYYAFVRAT